MILQKLTEKTTVILATFIITVFLISGCIETKMISQQDAATIAVNDSETRTLIQNHEFSVVDVSLASVASGETNPREMYAVTIKVQNSTPERIVVFVNFDGSVYRVDSPYTAKAPESLIDKQPSGLYKEGLDRTAGYTYAATPCTDCPLPIGTPLQPSPVITVSAQPPTSLRTGTRYHV